MYFKNNYLRILKPRTVDGNALEYNSDKTPVYKETTAPVTARRAFENRNRILPDHLKMTIELVSTSPDEVRPIATRQNPVERKKPGPKPKQHAKA